MIVTWTRAVLVLENSQILDRHWNVIHKDLQSNLDEKIKEANNFLRFFFNKKKNGFPFIAIGYNEWLHLGEENQEWMPNTELDRNGILGVLGTRNTHWETST